MTRTWGSHQAAHIRQYVRLTGRAYVPIWAHRLTLCVYMMSSLRFASFVVHEWPQVRCVVVIVVVTSMLRSIFSAFSLWKRDGRSLIPQPRQSSPIFFPSQSTNAIRLTIPIRPTGCGETHQGCAGSSVQLPAHMCRYVSVSDDLHTLGPRVLPSTG